MATFFAPAYGAPLFLAIPNAQASTLGNDSSGSLAGSGGTGEFQVVIGKSQFASVAGPLSITQLAYRLKPGTGSINATATSFSLSLSTTTYAPNGNGGNTLLTTTFATNRGPDNTQVLAGSGTLWSSPGCAGPGACPFDIVLTFTTPFLYDPSKGFLLLDTQITGYNGVGTGEFDVQNFFSPNNVLAELVGSNGSPTGALEFGTNVTQLGYTLATPTPEPASYAFVLTGLGMLAAICRRRKS